MKRKEEIQHRADEIIRKGDFGLLSDYEVTTHVATEIAKWADKTMIDKATKWLKDNVEKYIEIDGWSDKDIYEDFNMEEMLEDFRKAMRN